jgi:hypothetical protein
LLVGRSYSGRGCKGDRSLVHCANEIDPRHLVLLPAITPNIIFNAEIEFEHAGTAFDNDDKLHRAVDIEQL